jgi:hypothetical protein
MQVATLSGCDVNVTAGSEEALERHMHMPGLKDKQPHPYKKLVDIPCPFMR